VSRYSPQSRSRGRHLLNPTPRVYHAILFGFCIPEKGSVPSSSYLDVSAGGQFFATASSKRRWGYFTTGKTRPRGHILPLIMPTPRQQPLVGPFLSVRGPRPYRISNV
jgi:hypothetical protein